MDASTTRHDANACSVLYHFGNTPVLIQTSYIDISPNALLYHSCLSLTQACRFLFNETGNYTDGWQDHMQVRLEVTVRQVLITSRYRSEILTYKQARVILVGAMLPDCLTNGINFCRSFFCFCGSLLDPQIQCWNYPETGSVLNTCFRQNLIVVNTGQ